MIAMCWSGGKDSALALRLLLENPDTRPVVLVTTCTEDYDRISMHGVRRALLHEQAESIGIPLREVFIPAKANNAIYEARMGEAFEALKRDLSVTEVAFGDIFLEDLKVYRENQMAAYGLTCRFPIWKELTQQLLAEFIGLGFRAVTTCIDPRALDPSFVGRELNAEFAADLPNTVDPCGENGEFHTFVFDGPIFSSPVNFSLGETVERDSFYFRDLVPIEPPKT